MNDMREADVILSIRIKHESNGISISLSYYIEEVLKKFIYFECTPVSTPMDTSEKLMPNNGQAVSQLEYSSDTNEGYMMQVLKSIILNKIHASTSWQADAGKEAEWLRNLILDISLWSKPIALISIRCDSAATLAKAYSQMTPNSLLSKLLAEVQCEMLNVQKWNKAACFTFHPKYVLGTAEKQRKERSLLIPNRYTKGLKDTFLEHPDS
ncbi:hypothetical protein Tco_1182824 [Tanacetum coccineum]